MEPVRKRFRRVRIGAGEAGADWESESSVTERRRECKGKLPAADSCTIPETAPREDAHMTTISAVYEGGVFRPTEKFDLAEGDVVDLTVSKPAPPPAEPMTMDEWSRRIAAAKSIQEWADLANTCPDEDPEFDVIKAINESRRLTGFRMVDPGFEGAE